MNLSFPGVSGSARILGASAVAVSGAADTNENALATIAVPAGAMGVNGILRVSACWTYTNSANIKTLRGRLSGIGGTAFFAVTGLTTEVSVDTYFQIANRNSASSQRSMGHAPKGNNAMQYNGGTLTGAVDTTAATTLVLTGQKASAGETLTLESYLVELILP